MRVASGSPQGPVGLERPLSLDLAYEGSGPHGRGGAPRSVVLKRGTRSRYGANEKCDSKFPLSRKIFETVVYHLGNDLS
jgi:hypothetical protein